MLAVLKRELDSYYYSAIGYVFMGCFLLCFKLLSTLFALQLHVVNEYLKDLTALQEVRKDLIGGI